MAVDPNTESRLNNYTCGVGGILVLRGKGLAKFSNHCVLSFMGCVIRLGEHKSDDSVSEYQ